MLLPLPLAQHKNGDRKGSGYVRLVLQRISCTAMQPSGASATPDAMCPLYVAAYAPVYVHLLQSHFNSEDFTLFTLDDVDAVFDHMTKLKYSQTYQLQGEQ